MIISTGKVFATIIEATDKERSLLTVMLTSDEGECFVKDDKFYTGFIFYLKTRLDITDTDELPYPVVELESYDERLRDYQQIAVKKALFFSRGILQVGTGGGKTFIAASIINELLLLGFDKCIYIVPTGYLMQQVVDDLSEFGVKSRGVGYKSKFKNGFSVYVFVAKSAANAVINMDGAGKFIREAQVVIMDEVQHLASKTWVTFCENCTAPFRFGFTATAFEGTKSKRHPYTTRDLYLMGLTGNVILDIPSKYLRDRGFLAQPTIMMIAHPTKSIRFLWSPRVVYKTGIVKNKSRNEIAAHLSVRCMLSDYKVLTFVVQKDHAHSICTFVSKTFGKECIFVCGGGSVSTYKPSGKIDRRTMDLDTIKYYIESGGGKIVVATNVWDEGIDIKEVNVLIMAASMKKHRRYIQRAGRAMRPKLGNNQCFMFDFYDTNHNILESYSKSRMKTYQGEGYTFADSIDSMEKSMGIKLSDILITD